MLKYRLRSGMEGGAVWTAALSVQEKLTVCDYIAASCCFMCALALLLLAYIKKTYTSVSFRGVKLDPLMSNIIRFSVPSVCFRTLYPVIQMLITQ